MATTGHVPSRGYGGGAIKYVVLRGFSPNPGVAVATTGLTAAVIAGATYVFKAKLHILASAAGGHKCSMGGTCTATAVVYQIRSLDNSTGALVVTSKQTALNGAAGEVGATDVYTEIDGSIIVNVGGYLTVGFAQYAASGTSSILIGSSLEVRRIA